MLKKTTIVLVTSLIAAFATPALAQGQSYRSVYQPRQQEHARLYEGRNAVIIPAPDVPALPYTGREALIHAN
jgi:hypothetical protein